MARAMRSATSGQGSSLTPTPAASGGSPLQRAADAHQVARGGDTPHDAVDQPLQVGHVLQGLPDAGPQDPILDKALHLVQPPLYGLPVHQRLGDAGPQEPSPHRCQRPVQHAQKGALHSPLPQALRQFQVAAGGGVHHQEAVGGIGAEGGQLGQRALLGFLQVLEDGPGGADRQRFPLAAESLQRRHAEVVQEGLAGRARFKPVGRVGGEVDAGEVQVGEGRGGGTGGLPLPRVGEEALPGLEAGQFAGDLLTGQLGRGELPRGDFRVGQAGPVLVQDQRGQVVGAAGV